MFIAFEGIDGSGKSTLVKYVERYFRDEKYPVWSGFQPSDGKWGRMIRQYLHSDDVVTDEHLTSWYLKDRGESEHEYLDFVSDHLVILDRHIWSTAAYQGKDISHVESLYRQQVDMFLVPDLLFYVDLEPGVAVSRMAGKSLDRFETLENMSRVYENYEFLLSITECDVVRLDGRATVIQNLELVVQAVKDSLG